MVQSTSVPLITIPCTRLSANRNLPPAWKDNVLWFLCRKATQCSSSLSSDSSFYNPVSACQCTIPLCRMHSLTMCPSFLPRLDGNPGMCGPFFPNPCPSPPGVAPSPSPQCPICPPASGVQAWTGSCNCVEALTLQLKFGTRTPFDSARLELLSLSLANGLGVQRQQIDLVGNVTYNGTNAFVSCLSSHLQNTLAVTRSFQSESSKLNGFPAALRASLFLAVCPCFTQSWQSNSSCKGGSSRFF
jgi:hypothetical protein